MTTVAETAQRPEVMPGMLGGNWEKREGRTLNAGDSEVGKIPQCVLSTCLSISVPIGPIQTGA